MLRSSTIGHQIPSATRVVNSDEERRGLLITEQRNKPTTYTIQYTYNKNASMTSIVYPSGRTVTYNIDLTKGRASSIVAPVNGTNTTVLSAINYYPFGPVSGATFSNGKSLVRTYDLKYGISTNKVNTGVVDLAYTKDFESNILTITDNITPANNKTFQYDDRYQLKTGNGPWGAKSYTYFKNGNRKTKVLAGNTTTYNYTANTNRLSSTTGAEPATYSYDSNGNITNDSSNSFTYGDHNRLSQVIAGPKDFKYDGHNLRIKKIVTAGPISKTTFYLYNTSGMLIAERDLFASTWKDYLYLENEPVVRIDKSSSNVDTLNFYHGDHLGTPVAMTNSSGTVILRSEYFPFGKVYSQTGTGINNLRFPGQYFDTETSLHYNWWRYYSNKIGRYYEVDPLSVTKSDTNTYLYAMNNPITLSDPEGRLSASFSPFAIRSTAFAKTVCDGCDGFKWIWLQKPPCAENCFVLHEESHIDWFHKNRPEACKKRCDLCDPITLPGDHDKTECIAYQVSLSCLLKERVRARTHECKLFIGANIDRQRKKIEEHCKSPGS